MLDVSSSIREESLKSISGILKQVAKDAPEHLSVMTRKAACYVCDSLRARTKKAPKTAPRKEWSASLSPAPPAYITYRRQQKLSPALHRWRLTRKIGTPDVNTHDYFVYCHTKTNKKGKTVQDLAAERKELKQYHLNIFHAGLARQSWNWIKGEIGSRGGSSDVVWKRRKRDRRNPKDSVKGKFEAVSAVMNSGSSAEIHNRLDYISEACPSSAVAEAAEAAKNRLVHEFNELMERLRASL